VIDAIKWAGGRVFNNLPGTVIFFKPPV